MKVRIAILLICISALKIAVAGCYQLGEKAPNVQQRNYLQATVAPCIQIEGNTKDPCARRMYWDPNPVFYGAHTRYYETPVRFRDGISRLSIGSTPHIIARALGLPGTTRCAPQATLYLYGDEADAGSSTFYCFTDFDVRSYIIGQGPEKLTVNVAFGHHLTQAWNDEMALYSASAVSEVWEGYEWVIFIAPHPSAAVEAWSAIWADDVQRLEDGTIAAVSQSAHYHRSEIEDGVLDRKYLRYIENPLDEFELMIKQDFPVLEGKEVGDDPNRPSLIQDANADVLHKFYVGQGAYDNLTVTPAPPPPVPGENDPYIPGTRVDDPPPDESTVAVPGALDDTATDTPTPTPTPTPTSTPTVTPEPNDDGQGGGSAVSGQARRLRHIDSTPDGLHIVSMILL